MLKAIIRPLTMIVAAAFAPSLAIGVTGYNAMNDPRAGVAEIALSAAQSLTSLIFCQAVLLVILVGVPAFLLLKRFGALRLWWVVLAGAVAGLLASEVCAFAAFGHQGLLIYGAVESWPMVGLPFAGLGILSALTAWGLRKWLLRIEAPIQPSRP